MARVRLTLFVRNTEGVKAKLRAKTARQKERVRQVSLAEAQNVFDLAQALAPRDTNWMADHLRLEITRDGFNWRLGFRREDFVGQVNTNVEPARKITAFYPLMVVHGTRFMAGRDFLTAALRMRRQQILAGYRRAVKG